MTQLTPDITYVPLPENAIGICFNEKLHSISFSANGRIDFKYVGGSDFELLFTSQSITEEKAKMVVEWTTIQETDLDLNPIGEIEYTFWVGKVAYKTALDAWPDFLKSLSLNDENYAVIKRVG